MSCGKLSSEATAHLVSLSTSAAYAPLTPWYPAAGVDDIKAVMKLRALTGNFQCQLAIQVAEARTDVPAASAPIGTQQTAAGEYCTEVLSVASTTASKFFVRFGVMYNLSSAPGLGQADVSLQVTLGACGEVVASTVKELKTPDTSTVQYDSLTAWIPALDADAVKAAFLVTGASSTFKYRLACRTATTSTASANAWTQLEADWSTTAERCTGDLPLTIGSHMWVQFGVAHVLNSTGSNGGATVAAVVAKRKA